VTRIDLATRPARAAAANEDYAAASVAMDTGVVVVLDGVTPPADGECGCTHGLPWFTERLGTALVESVGSAAPLPDCLAVAIRRTAAAHPACDLSHRRTPQATVALLRWSADRVEYLVLSDAAVLLAAADGTVTPVLDSRLDELRARRLGNLEALRNVPGGFHTAAADPTVAALAVTGAVDRTELRGAAALTDGATRWTELFRHGDWTDLYAVLRTEGATALLDKVRATEATDPDRELFPRGKVSDDATAVHIGLPAPRDADERLHSRH